MIDLSQYTKELSKLFTSSDNILIVCHLNPDGDAVGSQLALYHYLKSLGKKVEMISPNYLQEFLKWMEGADQIKIFIRNRKKCRTLISEAGLIVMVDFNQSNRLGEAEKDILSSGATKVIIDHHLLPGDFADLVISDPSRCATAELMFDLIKGMSGNGMEISKPLAEALYVGIITDTGNFEHGSYSSSTLRAVADLLETGIEKERMLDLLYNNFSAGRMRLLGYAINKRMVVMPEYRTAYIFLTRDDLTEYGYVKGDTEGFVNIPLSIRGITFSALFIEKDGFIKLSFRSKGNFPSNIFAMDYFSGGGHLNASGGENFDNLENTIDKFMSALKENVWRFGMQDE